MGQEVDFTSKCAEYSICFNADQMLHSTQANQLTFHCHAKAQHGNLYFAAGMVPVASQTKQQ